VQEKDVGVRKRNAMNTKKWANLLGLFLIVLVVAGCDTIQESAHPNTSVETTLPLQETPKQSLEIIEHPKPALEVGFPDVFNDAGCPIGEYGYRLCEEDSPIRMVGCPEIREANVLLGGFVPSYPIVECVGRGGGIKELYSNNCHPLMSLEETAFVIYRNDSFEMISSLEDLRTVYAPIESEMEALSYALAATGLSAIYKFPSEIVVDYLVDQVESTHVVKLDEDYIVHLYGSEVCGCGHHPTSIMDVHVKKDGSISTEQGKQVYQEKNTICRD
jgi:hypothetical protein